MSALGRTSRDAGYTFQILDAVQKANEFQKSTILRKVEKIFGKDLSGKTFAIWGLSFKPKTDDMREAPSLTIIDGLLKRGAKVVAHDPEASKEARRILGDSIRIVDSNYDAYEGADALLVLTEWGVYQRPDFESVQSLLKNPIIIDGRNIYNPERMKAQGFNYISVGRSAV